MAAMEKEMERLRAILISSWGYIPE